MNNEMVNTFAEHIQNMNANDAQSYLLGLIRVMVPSVIIQTLSEPTKAERELVAFDRAMGVLDDN